MTAAARSILTAGAFLATATPAIALASAAIRGGIGPAIYTDLYVTSTLLATTYAVVTWRRLRRPTPTDVPARQWIAAAYHLLLTALGTGLTTSGYLYFFPEQVSDFADTQPVVIFWAMFHLIGIAFGELGWRTCIRALKPTERPESPHRPTERRAPLPHSLAGVEAPTLERVAPRAHDKHCRCPLDS